MPPRERGRRQPRRPSAQDADEQPPWAIIYYQAPDENGADGMQIAVFCMLFLCFA